MPTIKNKVLRDAFVGLVGISQVPMVATIGLQVARLLAKLRPEVELMDEEQRKVFIAAGGVQEGNSMKVLPIERRELESDADFAVRLATHNATVAQLNEQMAKMENAETELDFKPVSVKDMITPDGKPASVKPECLLLAGPFVTD